MSKDQAIKAVKEVTEMSLPWNDRHYEALQMAIEALEHPPIVAAMCTCPRCGCGFTIDLSEGGAEA